MYISVLQFLFINLRLAFYYSKHRLDLHLESMLLYFTVKFICCFFPFFLYHIITFVCLFIFATLFIFLKYFFLVQPDLLLYCKLYLIYIELAIRQVNYSILCILSFWESHNLEIKFIFFTLIVFKHPPMRY